MDSKLIAFLKKVWTFLKGNFITLLVIIACIAIVVVTGKIASNKIANLNKDIVIQNTNIAILQESVKKKEADNLQLQKDKEQSDKDSVEHAKNEKKYEDELKAIREKYKTLQEQIGKMSVEEKDKLLVETLKKYNVIVTITANMMEITMENRETLLRVMVNMDTLEATITNLNKQLSESNGQVLAEKEGRDKCEGQLVIKDGIIKDKDKIIVDKDKIIKDWEKKYFWIQVESIAKKAVPAFIIGATIGYLIKK